MEQNRENFCLVCGLNLFGDPAFMQDRDFGMCSCCGFEYGIDDVGNDDAYLQARLNWIREGLPFGVNMTPSDRSWTLDVAINQLKNLQLVKNSGSKLFYSETARIKFNPNFDEIDVTKYWGQS